jgi:hypothetical protein
MPDEDLAALVDEPLAALVRAIASELLELGYRPTREPGYVRQGETSRLVARETWQAMNELIGGRKP